MPLKIRLARGGSKKRPYYRIVVADSRMPRDGRFIEKIGTHNPLLPKDSDERVTLKVDRAYDWIKKGAKPTDRVARFLSKIHVKVLTDAEIAAAQAEAQQAITEGGENESGDTKVAASVAPVVRVEEGQGTPLYRWEAGKNMKKAEPGQKAKERIEERKAKEEARKEAEEEAKRAAAEAAAEAAKAPAEEPAVEEPAEASGEEAAPEEAKSE